MSTPPELVTAPQTQTSPPASGEDLSAAKIKKPTGIAALHQMKITFSTQERLATLQSVDSERGYVQLGAKGQHVEVIQNLLNEYAAKHDPSKMIAVNGVFDPKMMETLKWFQRENHLRADGVIGPRTWRKLTVGDFPIGTVEDKATHVLSDEEMKKLFGFKSMLQAEYEELTGGSNSDAEGLGSNSVPLNGFAGFENTGPVSLKKTLSPRQVRSINIIRKVFKDKFGITDERIIAAASAYCMLESGLNPRSTLTVGEQSYGLFQLGPEVGLNGSQLMDPEANAGAIGNRHLDRRIFRDRVPNIENIKSYCQPGGNGLNTFLAWYKDHPQASLPDMAQVFGMCINPSSATLRGERPYARVCAGMFFDGPRSVVSVADPVPATAPAQQTQPAADPKTDTTIQFNTKYLSQHLVSEKKRSGSIDTVVVHETQEASVERSIQMFQKHNTGAQLIIDTDGTVYQIAPLEAKTSHATIANDRSIGIEIVANHLKGIKPTAAQEEALRKTLAFLKSKYGIEYVTNHTDVQKNHTDCEIGIDLNEMATSTGLRRTHGLPKRRAA